MADVVGGTVVWDLDVNNKKLNAGIDSAKSKIDSLGKTADSSLSGVVSSMKRAEGASRAFAAGIGVAGTALLGSIGFGARIAGDLEAAQQGFVALLGSADKAQETMDRIKKEASATPFELTGLVEGAQALTAITKDGNSAVDILLDVGKAIATSGRGQADLDRVVLNLQQIASTGQVTAMDIRQFQSAIPIFNDIVEANGMTVESLKDSETAAEDLFEAFRKAGEEGGITSQGFEAQAGTFNQVLSNLKDNVTILSSELVKELGIFEGLKNIIGGVNDVLGDQELVISTVKDALGVMADNIGLITGAILGGLAPAFGGLILSIVTSPLLGWIAAGAVLGFVIQNLSGFINDLAQRFGGWGEIATTVRGKVSPLLDLIKTIGERIGQLVAGTGVSFEFGGLINAFSNLAENVDFYTKRAFQIVEEFFQNIKNFLAFGGTEGDASIVQAIEGIWNRIRPIKDALLPAFDSLKESFALTGQIVQTQLKPAFEALMEVAGPFIDSFLGLLIPQLKVLAKVFIVGLAASIVVVVGLIAGLITGIANALPYLAQAVEGIIQIFRGLVQIIHGIITLDLAMIWEGMKQTAKGAWDFFTNLILAVLKSVSGFVKGVIEFFTGLYDKLVGNSIIPDLVNDIVGWFARFPDLIKNALSGLVDAITKPFKEAWDKVKEIAGGIKEELQKINPFHRESPSLVDNVTSGVKEIKDQFSSLGSLSFPVVASPSFSPAETERSGGASGSFGGGFGQPQIVINIGEVKDKSDIEMISREIAFRSGLNQL